ncbi:JAB domain-containing protein [Pseudalkalibacillus sp. A8]
MKHVLFHPSQDTTPSREDIEVTNRMVESGWMGLSSGSSRRQC